MASFLSLKRIRDVRYSISGDKTGDGSKGFDRNFASFKCKLHDKFLSNWVGMSARGMVGVNCSLRENNYEGECSKIIEFGK